MSSSSTSRIVSAPRGALRPGDDLVGCVVSVPGNEIRNVAPCPGDCSTQISPPVWRTIPWTIASPRPEPSPTAFVREERLEDARARRVVHAVARVGDRHDGVAVASLVVRIVNVPPSGIASRAFRARLTSTWPSCPQSA